jgi:hypothetical protein
MSNELNNDPALAQFVDGQLARARASLRRSRVFCVCSIVFLLGYMSFITYTLETRLLQPRAAAQLATAYVSNFVAQEGPRLSDQVVEKVPAYIAGLPDALLAKLPDLRAEAEKQIESALNTHSREIAAQFGEHLDEFLADNHDQVIAFLEGAQDAQLFEKLGEEFERDALSYLHEKGENGYSAMDKLEEAAQALRTLEAQLDRLAHARDLTPQEKTIRQIIAITLKSSKNSA